MPEMNFNTLQCERAGTVATVTLHRPAALNAINAEMMTELQSAFVALADEAAVRVVLLTGSGERAFAAGADIRELQQTDAASGRTVSERGQQVFNFIERCGKPVIACIHGAALGGGLELALACTIRIASGHAKLGLPEAKLGLIPGFGGVHRLLRTVGRSAALRMMLTGGSIDSEEALRLGLIDEAVDAERLMSRARALADEIADLAPLAVAGILTAVQAGEGRPIDEGFTAEREIFSEVCASADKHEGLAAFVEKRKPIWQGR